MKKWLIPALCALVLVGLVVGAYFLYDSLSEDHAPEDQVSSDAPAPEDRPAAPDFTVYDQNGKAVKLSDLRGKPVVLNFWASWCGPCKSEMPAFDEAYRQLGDDIHFMMVNLTEGRRETVDTAKEFLATTDYTFPVYFDTDISAAIQYTTGSIPITYFLDSEGRLVAYASGAINAEMLARGIDMITE